MRWFLLSFALVVGIAQSQEPTPGSWKSSSENNADAKKSNQKTAPEQCGTEQRPFFVQTPGPTTQAERDHETYEKHEKPSLDRILSYSTAMLVVVTATLAFFTYWLWRATKTLVRESKETAKQQLRAYLSVRVLYPTFDPAKGLFVPLAIENNGQTPAHQFTISPAIFILDHEWSRNDALPGTEFQAVEAVIHPRSIFTAGAKSPAQTDIIQAVNAERYWLYVYGTARYEDVFKRIQRTDFFFRLTDFKPVKDAPMRFDAYSAVMPIHNEAT